MFFLVFLHVHLVHFPLQPRCASSLSWTVTVKGLSLLCECCAPQRLPLLQSLSLYMSVSLLHPCSRYSSWANKLVLSCLQESPLSTLPPPSPVGEGLSPCHKLQSTSPNWLLCEGIIGVLKRTLPRLACKTLLSFAKKPLRYLLILYYVGKRVVRIRNEGIGGKSGGEWICMCMAESHGCLPELSQHC